MFTKRKHQVYHISSGEAGCTSPSDIAKMIEHAFPDAPQFNFIGRELVHDVKMWARKRLNETSILNDHSEYLEYWNSIMDDASELLVLMGGLDPYIEFSELGQVFDNTKLMQSGVMVEQPRPANEYLKNSIHLIKNIDIFEAALEP